MNVISLRLATFFSFAGKVDDLKKKFPDHSKEIDRINNSPAKKFLEWSVKQLVSGEKIEDIIPTVELFIKSKDRLKEKDINKYDLKELETELKNLPKSKTKEKKDTKTTGSTKLFEDETYVVIRIDEKQACLNYGAGTKWCITMEDASYYEEYKESNVLFYFVINKTLDQSNDLYKVAFAIIRNEKNKILGMEIFDAEDNEIPCPSDLKRFESIIKSDALKQPDAKEAQKRHDAINNPEKYMNNPDSSIRQIVALHIDKKFLPQFMNDENEAVRKQVAERIDLEYLPEMMNDENTMVRAEIADRIDPKYLPQLINDSDEYVRRNVVNRIDKKYLPQMINDSDYSVRKQVAKRIDPSYLPQMMNDEDDEVIQEIIRRIDKKYLPQMINDENPVIQLLIAERNGDENIINILINDENFNIRYLISKNIDKKYLPRMMNDENGSVLDNVAERIDVKYLPQMLNNEKINNNNYNDENDVEAQIAGGVRAKIAERIDPKYLPQMMTDDSYHVRTQVAERIDLKYLPQMIDDVNPDVNKIVEERLRYH